MPSPPIPDEQCAGCTIHVQLQTIQADMRRVLRMLDGGDDTDSGYPARMAVMERDIAEIKQFIQEWREAKRWTWQQIVGQAITAIVGGVAGAMIWTFKSKGGP